jgi:D-lactate dehydrogenase (cytochrome)
MQPTDDWLSDSANFPGGHSPGFVFPQSTADVVDALAGTDPVLVVGAQSSLTGGATPMGETIVATTRMARIVDVVPGRITVEPGVTVAAMQERLRAEGAWFAPVPTFTGAFAGGIVATNAAGAATFKYGSTRDWVEALTVVLADGTVLDIARGQSRAHDGRFELQTRSGAITIPVPTYRMPRVPKCSAGYFAAPGMDLVDLFVGSEGTLGVITRITFRTLSPPPNIVFAWIPCRSESQGLSLVRALRDASIATREARTVNGIDACAIEHIDRRSLAIVREDGVDARHNVGIPQSTELALLVQLEIAADKDAASAFDEIQRALVEPDVDGALARLCRLLDAAGVLEDTELAMPFDSQRAADFLAVREAVPSGVNRRIRQAKQAIDPRIEKTAGDMIVPFDRCGEMMDVYRRGFESRGLDYAIWGHLSDGNVHPNVIARSYEDVVKGKEAMLEFGRHATRLGGCALAEHGVGRNPVKQALLEQLYGEAGLDEMRAVKRAVDPGNRLAPGVIFSAAGRDMRGL